MRIALIAHNLRAGGGISVGRNLIAAMGRVAPENEYFVSIPPGLGYEEVWLGLPSCQSSVFGHGGLVSRWRYDTRTLPALLGSFRPDLVFGLGNMLIGDVDAPQAMLCHNPFLWYPSKHFGQENLVEKARHALVLSAKRQKFARDLRKASLVLCQTETARRRIQERYRFDTPTALCPNAVSEHALAGRGDTGLPEKLSGTEGKIRLFCLTRYYRHKNLERLIETFDRFRDKLRNHVLVLTIDRNQHRRAAALLDAIRDKRLGDLVINVGPLQQSELAAYYANCDALLLPTLVESYSGTYLEAMTFGCAVVTSDLDFAREVCGEAALYFDPWDHAAIAEAILALPKHSDLVEMGWERIRAMQQPTWDEIASRILGELARAA